MEKGKDRVILYQSFFDATTGLKSEAKAELWDCIGKYLNGVSHSFKDRSAELAWNFIVIQLNTDKRKNIDKKEIQSVLKNNNKESNNDFRLHDVLEAAKDPSVALSQEEAKSFYDHYAKQGWVFGNGQPVKRLQPALRAWKKGNALNKQRSNYDQTHINGRPNRNAGTYNDGHTNTGTDPF